MDKPGRSRVLRSSEAQSLIPGPAGEHAATVLQRGPLDVALSIPPRPTRQLPHAQDEIDFIIGGRALFLHDGKRDPVGSGDLVFVAAGTEHQLEDCSDRGLLRSRTTPRSSPSGASSMARMEARSPTWLRPRHRKSNWAPSSHGSRPAR